LHPPLARLLAFSDKEKENREKKNKRKQIKGREIFYELRREN
jgi:hypothetical protein